LGPTLTIEQICYVAQAKVIEYAFCLRNDNKEYSSATEHRPRKERIGLSIIPNNGRNNNQCEGHEYGVLKELFAFTQLLCITSLLREGIQPANKKVSRCYNNVLCFIHGRLALTVCAFVCLSYDA